MTGPATISTLTALGALFAGIGAFVTAVTSLIILIKNEIAKKKYFSLPFFL